MEILSKWREAHTTGIRKEFEDAIAKAPGPKAPARSAFLNTITQTHGTLLALYSAASQAERRAILRYAKNTARSMWRQGAWPSALGFEIASLNVASHFVPSADADYVRAETDKIIEEAERAQKSMNQHDRLPVVPWMTGGAAFAGLVPRPCRRGRDRLRQLAIEVRQIKQAAYAEIADQAFRLSRRVSR